MKQRRHLIWVTLALAAVLLALAGKALASGGVIHLWGDHVVDRGETGEPCWSCAGVIHFHYWGDHVVDLVEDPSGNPIGFGEAPDPISLPEGRLSFKWQDGSEYKADSQVTMDLISGNWYFDVEAIVEPSGVMKAGGTGASFLDHFGGKGCDDEGGGGWKGEFHGVILANGDAILNGNNEGCGALEGWRMKHHEEWRGLDPDTNIYSSRTFSGHFKPPQGWVPE